jgi:hypothetical protein
MNIIEMIKEGLRIARTSKSLWLYGFFVGLGTTVNSKGNGHVPGAPAVAHLAPHAFTGVTALLAIAILVLIAAVVFMYFVSEGALIEGVTRVRLSKTPTVREGWRDGLAHWGVLFRIAVIYFAISVGSLVVLATPFLLALKLSGTALAVTFAVPAVLIAVPWLVTLYMWQAFAARIAVLENRGANDAIGKARLFLHGRLLHGLKLIVAAFLGRLIVVVVGAVALAVVAAFVFLVQTVFGMTHAAVPVIALGAMLLLPIVLILVAISGTTQSSIWTIGYLTQEGQ